MVESLQALDPFRRYRTIFAGLETLLEESQSYTQQIPRKLAKMQEIHLQRHPSLYDEVQVRKLRYYLNAFAYKDLLVALRLEEMWSIEHAGPGDRPLLEVLANIYDEHDTTDKHIVLLSFALDDFLLQATAFLDFYMLHLRAFFLLNDKVKLTTRTLIRDLAEVREPALRDKAKNTEAYFRQRVLAESGHGLGFVAGWGKFLRDLRNSTVHRDILYPTFDTGERLVDKIIEKWPARLRDTNAIRFAQDIQNDMFTMITTSASMLYDLDWKAGPYRDDLWGI